MRGLRGETEGVRDNEASVANCEDERECWRDKAEKAGLDGPDSADEAPVDMLDRADYSSWSSPESCAFSGVRPQAISGVRSVARCSKMIFEERLSSKMKGDMVL